ncbi:MAG: HD domain-containing protein [Pirellulales bacterium]|nr:HD domain-containing protein [Pirellulales bacterium]
MSRRFVSQLGPQESVDQIFLVSDKQLRPNRNGNLYLQVELSDRTGSVGARMWNASEKLYNTFENGDYARVEGSTQLFQGAIQLILTRLSRIAPDEVNEDEFQPLTSVEVDRLVLRLGEMLRGMENLSLRNLAECFLLDETFMAKLTRAPAGVKNHHAYLGGLLEHTVQLMEIVLRIAPCYPELDRDLLLTGAFLHDAGKLDELSYDRGFAYSDEGQLVGHLVMAVGLLDAKVAEAERLAGEPIAAETVLRLKHMLVSHHGEYEFGSPKLPMTLEAVALAFLDNLDAKMASFSQQLRDDPNVDSHWTAYNSNLRRKLFKGETNCHEPLSENPENH